MSETKRTDSNKFLGIEFGSTRIKAVTVDGSFCTAESGDHSWESTLENGIWTYDLEDAKHGFIDALGKIKDRDSIAGVGISGMMHGYLAFDEDWNLLVPFRTWQNTITGEAADRLTEALDYNTPQRWSAAHLFSAILKREAHLDRLAHVTTISGYFHYLLTGVNGIGVGEAGGMFPLSDDGTSFHPEKMEIFRDMIKAEGYDIDPEKVFPKIIRAGECAGRLTEEGSALIEGLLKPGLPFAPPEGDAATGMVATCAVSPGTGNVSAGTSVFAMVVLDKPLSRVYREIDMISTPEGRPVAMVHCNNCTTDSNKWVSLIREAAVLFGADISEGEAFTRLYLESLKGEADCGGVIACNYIAGEHTAGVDNGIPMVVRHPDSRFTLANFFRATLYSTLVTLSLGMRILKDEQVEINSLTGHGGLFKTPGVGQRYLAAAAGAEVTCMETAGEGGPYGMALLAAYMVDKRGAASLEEYLTQHVFSDVSRSVIAPTPEDIEGFEKYAEAFSKLLEVEKLASKIL
ncbi:MAG: ATPase [Clostridia bacterium]|nr:ATPase [Clostridia bacterium]